MPALTARERHWRSAVMDGVPIQAARPLYLAPVPGRRATAKPPDCQDGGPRAIQMVRSLDSCAPILLPPSPAVRAVIDGAARFRAVGREFGDHVRRVSAAGPDSFIVVNV